MKKILYICNRLPNNENAGGILYDDILRKYGLENFRIISVSNKINFTEFNKHYQNLSFKQFSLRLPNSNIFYKVLKKMPLIEPIYMLLKKMLILKKIIKYAQFQDCEIIFAPLRGEVLLVLDEIIKATKLPLIAMVEDTVEREIDDHKSIYKLKKQQYYELLSKTSKLAVAGETMQNYFMTNFKINSIIIRPSYLKYSDYLNKQIESTINIFFSGNIYANKEMNVFLNALPLFGMKNPHLQINMYVASHRPVKLESDKVNVINLGWLKENKLIDYMQKCHISYLPYKSEPSFAHSMKYAFPAKAGFYITNNLPIFFHGPVYSSFNTFLKKYKVGVSCASMDCTVISEYLESFLKDPFFYSNCQKECFKAYEYEFTTNLFAKRVFQLFDN